MKSQPEITKSVDHAFDRTSTREELYQVMELLGGPLSAVVAPHGAAAQKSVPLSAPAGSEQGVLEEADLWDLWNDADGESEPTSACEIEPLADLLHSNRQLLN
jgi:hypothetical protein